MCMLSMRTATGEVFEGYWRRGGCPTVLSSCAGAVSTRLWGRTELPTALWAPIQRICMERDRMLEIRSAAGLTVCGFTFGFAGPGWAREQQLRRRINTERPLHTTLIRRWHSVRRAGEIAIRRAAHTAMYGICVRGHTCVMRGAAQRGLGAAAGARLRPPRARARGTCEYQ